MVDLEHADAAGLTQANESRPAPRITYCRAPDAASQSSVMRDRADTQVASSGEYSPNIARDAAAIVSASAPINGHASQSCRTARGPYVTRCAPLADAAIIAVRLTWPVCEMPEGSFKR
jgi:hypothetical protein